MKPARCLGIGSQGRDLRIATNGARLLAGRSSSLLSTLDDLCAKPCEGYCGLRLRGRGDSSISHSLRLSRDGGWEPEARTCECDAPTHFLIYLTLQQPREAIPSDHAYRCLIHNRSGVFSEHLDQAIEGLGVAVLKTPVRAPQANS